MHVVLEEGREEMIILENDSIALRGLLLNYLIDLYVIRLRAFLQMRFFCVIANFLARFSPHSLRSITKT